MGLFNWSLYWRLRCSGGFASYPHVLLFHLTDDSRNKVEQSYAKQSHHSSAQSANVIFRYDTIGTDYQPLLERCRYHG